MITRMMMMIMIIFLYLVIHAVVKSLASCENDSPRCGIEEPFPIEKIAAIGFMSDHGGVPVAISNTVHPILLYNGKYQ